jgi:hypothetical protein
MFSSLLLYKQIFFFSGHNILEIIQFLFFQDNIFMQIERHYMQRESNGIKIGKRMASGPPK